MKVLMIALTCLLLLNSCKKESVELQNYTNAPAASANKTTGVSEAANALSTNYTLYTIRAGNHYCDQNVFRFVSLSQVNIMVKFDQSAIYQTVIPENQYDINKLWGFSEGLDHQYNSARLGWDYYDGYLRLFAYAYNKGVRESQEITKVDLNTDITCSIKLSGYSYIFTVNGVSVTLPRANATKTASGYQLYPYFGGDEAAPHNISIWIKTL